MKYQDAAFHEIFSGKTSGVNVTVSVVRSKSAMRSDRPANFD